MSTRNGGVRLRDRVPFVRGAAFGGLAYVLGYALTYVATAIDGVDPGQYGNDAVMIVGWRFYAAHFVGLSARSSEGVGPNELLEAGPRSVLAPTVYHLLVVAVLVVASYHVVRTADSRFRETATVLTTGASLVGGYLPLAVIGAVLFRVHGDASLAISVMDVSGPDPLASVALVGLVIPAVCGAVGACIGRYVRRARTRSDTRSNSVEG
jgi:hypothetical protein